MKIRRWRRWKLAAEGRPGTSDEVVRIWNERPEWFLTRGAAERAVEFYRTYQPRLDLPVEFHVVPYDQDRVDY